MITTPEKKMRVRYHSSLSVHNNNDHVSSKQNPCDLTYNAYNRKWSKQWSAASSLDIQEAKGDLILKSIKWQQVW